MKASKKLRFGFGGGLAVIALGIVAGLSGGPALAATPPRVATATESASLTVTGFDAAQAAAAGNSIVDEGNKEVLESASGEVIASIPVSASGTSTTTSDAVVPLATGEVVGDCGDSFVTIDTVGDYEYKWRTGFHGTPHDVVQIFSWDGAIYGDWSDGNYDFNWELSGAEPFANNWASSVQTEDPDALVGAYFYIRLQLGTVLLDTGELCTSGYPTASIYLGDS